MSKADKPALIKRSDPQHLRTANTVPLRRRISRGIERNRKKILRYGLFAANAAVVLVALAIVLLGRDGNAGTYTALNTAVETKSSSPLDTLSAADIAANIAIMAQLPETGLIINYADSVSSQLTAPFGLGDTAIKPQILSSNVKTKEDVQEYIVLQGDTLASLATKFGVTSDSIKWSNSLVSNNISPGIKLTIPPVNGIVYTVRNGDTVDNLASRFGVSRTQIIQFNDIELSGLTTGMRIVVPDGTVRSTGGRTPYYARFAFGNTSVYGYNGYYPGYCTWYVANQRIQIGRPLPVGLGDAWTWDNYAIRFGYRVDRIPLPGAAVVVRSNSYPGHVAFVDEVYYNPDGSLNSVKMSDMNGRNILYEIRSFIVDAATAQSYTYIH